MDQSNDAVLCVVMILFLVVAPVFVVYPPTSIDTDDRTEPN